MLKKILLVTASIFGLIFFWILASGERELDFPDENITLGLDENELKSLANETETLIKQLMKIPSIRNNEKGVVDILQQHAEKAGLITKRILMDNNPERPILIVTLDTHEGPRENGLILANHTDVVEVEKDEWMVDPFGGIIHDDRIYGRGALDMKGMAGLQLATLIHIKKKGWKLNHPLMFLALPDEESGSGGAKYLVKHHKKELDGFTHMINEGGFATRDLPFPGATLVNINYAEKGSLWLRLRATGPSGHGSTPPKSYATKNLQLFLAEVLAWRNGITITDETRSFFAQLGKAAGFPKSFVLKRASHPLLFPLVKPVIEDSKHLTAMTTHSRSITSFGSPAAAGVNVIPSEATSSLDFRLLPTMTSTRALEELTALARNFNVTIEVVEKSDSTVSPIDDPLFQKMGMVAKKIFPSPVVTPLLPPGITDLTVFRNIGLKGYGLIPIMVNAEQIDGMHGKNEYISRQNIREGLQYFTTLIRSHSVISSP